MEYNFINFCQDGLVGSESALQCQRCTGHSEKHKKLHECKVVTNMFIYLLVLFQILQKTEIGTGK